MAATSGSSASPPPTDAALSSNNEAMAFIRQNLGDVLSEFPQEIRSSLYEKFCAEYASPLTQELEIVLHKRLTDDEVRHLMFCPTPKQYRYYPLLLSLRPSAPETTSSNNQEDWWPQVLQKRFTTLFYLKHARNWPLVAEFVLLGGLQVLVNQFLHPDLQLRGQTIDCFVQITSSSAFDWFQDPIGYESRLLHSKMVALAAAPSRFLHSLVHNIKLYDPRHESARAQEDVGRLPGGTFVMLQILAFFLSWVRKFYSQPKNELRLGRELLDLLRDWRERTQTQEQAELELAQQVFEDFSRWPAIEDSAVEASKTTERQLHVGDLISAASSSADTKSAPFFSREHVLNLLDPGADGEDCDENDASAITICSEAIAAKVCLFEAYSLRARALVQRIERKASSSGLTKSAPVHDDVQRLLDDCASVLSLDPTNVEARKYRLRVFAAMEMWSEAQEMLEDWVATATDDAFERQFLPEDVAFFKEQHVIVTEKSRAKAREEARLQQLNAIKLSKQEVMLACYVLLKAARIQFLKPLGTDENSKRCLAPRQKIFQAILQRDGALKTPQRPESSGVRAQETSNPLSSELDSSELETLSSSCRLERELDDLVLGEQTSSLMAKIASSNACKRKDKSKRTAKAERTKDHQTELMCRGHAFMRKFRKVKTDSAALTNLLQSTAPAALCDAFESALGEEHFITVFDALIRAKTSSEDTRTAEQATGILRLLLSSAKFQFFVEMGSELVRQRVRCCADEILDSPVASGADIDEELDADGKLGVGSACA